LYILLKAFVHLAFKARLLKGLCVKAFRGLLKIIHNFQKIVFSETLVHCGFWRMFNFFILPKIFCYEQKASKFALLKTF